MSERAGNGQSVSNRKASANEVAWAFGSTGGIHSASCVNMLRCRMWKSSGIWSSPDTVDACLVLCFCAVREIVAWSCWSTSLDSCTGCTGLSGTSGSMGSAYSSRCKPTQTAGTTGHRGGTRTGDARIRPQNFCSQLHKPYRKVRSQPFGLRESRRDKEAWKPTSQPADRPKPSPTNGSPRTRDIRGVSAT